MRFFSRAGTSSDSLSDDGHPGTLRRLASRLGLPSRGLSLQEAAERFCKHMDALRRSTYTIRSYRSDYRLFERFLREHNLPLTIEAITRQILESYLAAMQVLAPATVQRRLDSLAALFGYCVKEGIMMENPVARLDRPKRPERLPRALAAADVTKLLASRLAPLERVIVCAGLYGGLRRGEMLALDLDDTDWGARRIRVHGKGAKPRVIPMHRELLCALAEYLGHRRDRREGPVLLNAAGRRMGPHTIHCLFRRVLERAGLADRGYSLHSLRHTCATEMVRQGADIHSVKEFLGHTDIATTDLYLQADAQRTRGAVDRLSFSGDSRDGEVPDSSSEAGQVAVEIERSGLQGGMPEEVLERPDIAPPSQHQGGECVPEGVQRDVRLLDSGTAKGTVEQVVDPRHAEGQSHVVREEDGVVA